MAGGPRGLTPDRLGRTLTVSSDLTAFIDAKLETAEGTLLDEVGG